MADLQGFGSETLKKCARGCGFYGRPENKFLCSKCYNDYLKELIVKSVATVTQPSTVNHGSDGGTGATDPANCSAETAAKSNRCLCCKKKVGLTGFRCRCGGLFCGRHRYAEEHACKFDFKTTGRQLLIKENPLVIGDKIEERV